MLASFLSAPVTSTSSTFTQPTSTVIFTVSANTISSTSPLPLISSMVPGATQSSPSAPLPLLPQDAVVISRHLQQLSAVRQVTRDLQQRKPRHPKRSQLPPGGTGSPIKQIVHTAVNKQKLN